MSEKRFTIHKESKYKEEWYDYPFYIKEDGEVVLETIPLSIAEKVRDKLNEQLSIIRRDEMSIKTMMSNIEKLEKENEKLIQKNCIPCELVNLQTREIDNLKEENEQLKKQLEGDNL